MIHNAIATFITFMILNLFQHKLSEERTETAKARKEAAEWEKKFQVVKQEKDKL